MKYDPGMKKFARAFVETMGSIGHNLNSTASREERSGFISRIINLWNDNYTTLIRVSKGMEPSKEEEKYWETITEKDWD